MRTMAFLACAVPEVLLAPCCSTVAPPETLTDGNGPRTRLAVESANRLQEQFNNRACDSIFDDADVAFRLLQSREEWLYQCKRIRDRLGRWQSFAPTTKEHLGVPFPTVVEGEAVFTAGDGYVQTVWHLENGRARLFSFYVRCGGEQTTMPSSPFQVTKPTPFRDPPPRDTAPWG
jgi:hypothetical protein